MKRSLFIFRRDLRLEDNIGLLSALKASHEVILCFIFTPEQIETNSYKSNSALQFMIESLEDLEREAAKHGGKLHLFYGKPEHIVEECIKKLKIDGVFVNHDYTPYSILRDNKIKTVCLKHNVIFHAEHDLLLYPIETTLKSDQTPYTIFTPFFRNASKFDIPKPQQNLSSNYFSDLIPFSVEPTIYHEILPKRKHQMLGGRTEGLKILNNLMLFTKYDLERDFPDLNKTTHLSPHLKFTTCSTREVYYAILKTLGIHAELIRSLYWKEFFTLIAFHFPHVFKESFKEKFKNLQWSDNLEYFKLWSEGKTGFPIVDAGMRELNETGFMQNRVRMITSSFLIKDLHINWHWGEKYFAQHLIDYDPAVNNGNWQWSASTGCDAQPYFRIFNPWSQSKKFDPHCDYIKKWIPELKTFNSKVIHEWFLKKNYTLSQEYPKPIIEHSEESRIALESYKDVSSSL